VQLDQIEPVGAETLQASLDAREQRGRPPVSPAVAARVAALGQQVDLVPAGPEGHADQGLAVLVALGGVDHVEAGVERGAEQPGDGARARPFVADLGAAEAEDADHHVGLAEAAALHRDRSEGRGGGLELHREEEYTVAETPITERSLMSHYHDPADLKLLGEFKKLAPAEFKGFVELDSIVGRDDGKIPRKYRELIALAVACTTQCPYCLDVHTRNAKKAGATREEVVESAMLAAALRAGAATTHGALALKLFDQA
jgi:AhpD family alkylhydroperoxidase